MNKTKSEKNTRNPFENAMERCAGGRSRWVIAIGSEIQFRIKDVGRSPGGVAKSESILTQRFGQASRKWACEDAVAMCLNVVFSISLNYSRLPSVYRRVFIVNIVF